MHDLTLLKDLAWIMVAAAIASLIFQKIKLPPLLGYLAAGFFLGPHLGLWPAVADINNVMELSELGVIFLMFYIGLEFDFSKLSLTFAPAFAALALQTLLMLFVGMQTALLLGFPPLSGWFLGGLLSISSSMVSVKLIRERGLFQKNHAQMAVGILILEDILAIILLVVLNGMAAQGGFDWESIGRSCLLIGIFVAAVFVIGKISAPKLIQALETRGNSESITLATLGLIFGVALLADQFHFSWALGGFLAGAILSRSKLAHRIESLTEPLRDLFTALFFVTVGMLIEPAGIARNLVPIAALTAIVVVGKFVTCWIGLFFFGQSPRDAGRSALIKDQIGEFSFVIVAIGAKYGAISSDLHAIVSGVAFTTILLTPALIRYDERILNFLGRFSPRYAVEFCEVYSKWQGNLRLSSKRGSLLSLARRPLIHIGVDFLFINAVILAAKLVSENVPTPEFIEISRSNFQQGVFVLSLLVSLPFLVDTMRNLNVLVLLFSESAFSRSGSAYFSKGIMRNVFNYLILLLILFVYGMVFLIVAAPYFSSATIFLSFILITAIVGWIFWKRLARMHHSLELTFLNSLNQEVEERISERISSNLDKLRAAQPWKIKVEHFTLPENSAWAGKRIAELDLRNKTGTIIAAIERRGFEIVDIQADNRIFPFDEIFLLGDDDQIKAATAMLTELQLEPEECKKLHFSFAKFIVPPLCPFIDLTIAETCLRKAHRVTIVGIQREAERIVSPPPSQVIEEGDLLLLMGRDEDLEKFKTVLMPPGHEREAAM